MPGLSERRSRRRSRRGGVVRLNQGSSSYGVRNVLPLNSPGGTFGSGRTAGGGAGAGQTLAQALMAPAPSVSGSLSAVGPPPVTPSQVPAEEHPYVAPRPTFTPRPVQLGALGGFAPVFSPYSIPPDDPYRRFRAY